MDWIHVLCNKYDNNHIIGTNLPWDPPRPYWPLSHPPRWTSVSHKPPSPATQHVDRGSGFCSSVPRVLYILCAMYSRPCSELVEESLDDGSSWWECCMDRPHICG